MPQKSKSEIVAERKRLKEKARSRRRREKTSREELMRLIGLAKAHFQVKKQQLKKAKPKKLNIRTHFSHKEIEMPVILRKLRPEHERILELRKIMREGRNLIRPNGEIYTIAEELKPGKKQLAAFKLNHHPTGKKYKLVLTAHSFLGKDIQEHMRVL